MTTFKKVEVIEAKGVFLNVRIRMWGARSKLSEGMMENLPTDIVRATQDLLTEDDSGETLQQLQKIKSEVNKFIRLNSVPFPIYSFDMVRRDSISEINEQLKEKQKEFYELVNSIDIEKCKENFKKKHPKYYRPEKYPSQQYFKSHFEFTWSFHELKPSDAIMEVDPESKNRWKEQVKKMQLDTIQLIAADINMRVKNLRDMATGKKRVSQRTINGLGTLLDKWDDLWSGFISSKALKEAIKEIRNNIKDLDSEDLKFDKATKTNTKKVTKEILDTVKTEVESIGKRKLIY